MAEQDNVTLELLRKQLAEARAMRQPPLHSGDGGGTSDGMEARVKRLEDDVKEVRSDTKAIRIDLAEIRGKLSNMPSTWQMIGLMVGLLGLAFVILKLTVPTP